VAVGTLCGGEWVSTLRQVTLGQHLGYVPCYKRNLVVHFSSWPVAIIYMNWWWSLHSQPFLVLRLARTSHCLNVFQSSWNVTDKNNFEPMMHRELSPEQEDLFFSCNRLCCSAPNTWNLSSLVMTIANFWSWSLFSMAVPLQGKSDSCGQVPYIVQGGWLVWFMRSWCICGATENARPDIARLVSLCE